MAFRRSSGRPNDYDWELMRGTDLDRAAGSIVQFEALLSDTAETLMRVRGDVFLALGAVGQTVLDTVVGAWGLIRSASGSSDVGVSPITEGGAPWLAYGVVTLLNLEGSANLGFEGLTMKRWDVDSKSMRKLRENESIYVVVETADIVGARRLTSGSLSEFCPLVK